MLNRLDIRTEIIQVAEQADSNGALNAMNKLKRFLNDVKQHSAGLSEIDQVTKFLQTRCISLASARVALNA
jgi:hypothetical protein